MEPSEEEKKKKKKRQREDVRRNRARIREGPR